jgi:hypothetical protein
MSQTNEEVALLEAVLSLTLPKSYRDFLISDEEGAIYGLPVLGLPATPDLESAWGATEFLRTQRPDLDPAFLVIRIMDTRALCLDLRGTNLQDAPLVEIALDRRSVPRPLNVSFQRYLVQGQRDERQINGGLRRIEWHLKNGRKSYDHAEKGTPPPFRAHDWRVIRSCVHDQVVGLTALKHNEEFNGQEIDVFLSADHPDYESGHGVRALVMLILSDAYRNGASLELRFTRHDGRQNRRVPDRIPSALLSLGAELGVSFKQGESGLVSHEEAVSLFAAIVGLTNRVRLRVEELQDSARLSTQGLCYLLSTRLWTLEEASWIFLNFPRAEALVFGLDLPEDRLNYLESQSYGRAAIAGTLLCQKLQLTRDGFEGDSLVEVDGLIWRVEISEPTLLDWVAGGPPETVNRGERLSILPRPRPIFPGERERILSDAEQLCSASGDSAKKFLLYSFELGDLGDLNNLANELMRTRGVSILTLPMKTRELNLEVDRRIARARGFRT